MTTKELDDALRKAARDNAVIAHGLVQHDGQFTTEALYQIAIGLHEANQRLHAIAADAINRSAPAPIMVYTHSLPEEKLSPEDWEARCAAMTSIVEAATNLCRGPFDLTQKSKVLLDQARYQKLQAAVGGYRIMAERERRANNP